MPNKGVAYIHDDSSNRFIWLPGSLQIILFVRVFQLENPIFIYIIFELII